MAHIVKLWDEKDILQRLKADTVLIVQNCKTIPPMKKLIECHDILEMTIAIQNSFQVTFPDPLICDEGALLHLKFLVQEISIYYPREIPQPHFQNYAMKVSTLLRIFNLPKET